MARSDQTDSVDLERNQESDMSLDRSLKSGAGLGRHRNVLTRAERIEKLATTGYFKDGTSVYNLPKVGHRKIVLARAAKKDDAAADTKAAGAKAAAPAAGAKAAAPAAKAAPAKK
jgi:small basic protein (TIGR04137 family)